MVRSLLCMIRHNSYSFFSFLQNALALIIFTYFVTIANCICCGYSFEAPRRGASNMYPQHIFVLLKKKKKIVPAYLQVAQRSVVILCIRCTDSYFLMKINEMISKSSFFTTKTYIRHG